MGAMDGGDDGDAAGGFSAGDSTGSGWGGFSGSSEAGGFDSQRGTPQIRQEGGAEAHRAARASPTTPPCRRSRLTMPCPSMACRTPRGFGRSGFSSAHPISAVTRISAGSVAKGVGAVGPIGLFSLLSAKDHGQADLATQNAFADMDAENDPGGERWDGWRSGARDIRSDAKGGGRGIRRCGGRSRACWTVDR